MPDTAAARALENPARPLSQDEALEILNAMTCLVASSTATLKPNTQVSVAYEVWHGKRSYVFSQQPFVILREITYREYCQALAGQPPPGKHWKTRYYEIATD